MKKNNETTDVILVEHFHQKFKDKTSRNHLLEQSLQNDPSLTFHVISDYRTKGPCAHYYPLNEYKDVHFHKFEKCFTNLHTAPPELTFRFISRWFLCRNFIKKNNLSSALCLDNDILICSPVSSWPEEITASDYCLSQSHSAHTNLINNDLVLDAFTRYIIRTFSEKAKEFNFLKNMFLKIRQKPKGGGICDMALWKRLTKHQPSLRVFEDISQIFPNNTTFDHNINITDGYERSNKGIKNITRRGAAYYCKQDPSGNLIKFNTLHFQGAAKKYISLF